MIKHQESKEFLNFATWVKLRTNIILLVCPNYRDLRRKFFKPYFCHWLTLMKFETLLSKMSVTNLSKCIYFAFKRRNSWLIVFHFCLQSHQSSYYMYMYVTFCSSVNSVYFTFHGLHCVTIVNMVINIVLCFIPNKLLYLYLYRIYNLKHVI